MNDDRRSSIDNYGARGSGRTTRQLLALPQGGMFIVLNRNMLDYTKHLAYFLKRPDIQFITIENLQLLRGRKLSALELDHAVWPSRRYYDEYLILQHTLVNK